MTQLKHGATGTDVQQLQRSLRFLGLDVFVDGIYGDATEAAVRAYQRRAGLVVDGIAGTKTLVTLAGFGGDRLLGHTQLAAAAKRLGVELAAIYAVNEVESAGVGFLNNGKPKILFERHVMLQRLQLPRAEGDDVAELKRRAAELAAKYPNLVNTAPGATPAAPPSTNASRSPRAWTSAPPWSRPAGAPSRSWATTPSAWATPACRNSRR